MMAPWQTRFTFEIASHEMIGAPPEYYRSDASALPIPQSECLNRSWNMLSHQLY